ncbi:MAG: hypothetical protein AAF484_09970 [Pseudomonadota bacterium]
MRLLAFLSILVLVSCSARPLTEGEQALAHQIYEDTLDVSRIRLVDGALIGKTTYTRKKRPRVACRERIFPEPKEETVTVGPAAFVLFNRVYFAKDWYLPDYLPDYGDRMYLMEAMLFAHEMAHIWQWQNRDTTGYTPLRAANEHFVQDDPYLFDVDTDTRFLDFAYEQQASIVEEYICCAALDPDAPRTARLRQLLQQAMPVRDLELPDKIVIPWDGAETQGICRV